MQKIWVKKYTFFKRYIERDKRKELFETRLAGAAFY